MRTNQPKLLLKSQSQDRPRNMGRRMALTAGGRMAFAVTLGLASLVSACGDIGDHAFDYDAASREERAAWITPIAQKASKKFSYDINNYGALTMFKVREPQIDPGRNEVILEAELASSVHRIELDNAKRKSLKRGFCRRYVRSPPV